MTKLKAVNIGTSPVDIGFLISNHLEIPDMENWNVRTVQNKDFQRKANAQALRKPTISEREGN